MGREGEGSSEPLQWEELESGESLIPMHSISILFSLRPSPPLGATPKASSHLSSTLSSGFWKERMRRYPTLLSFLPFTSLLQATVNQRERFSSVSHSHKHSTERLLKVDDKIWLNPDVSYPLSLYTVSLSLYLYRILRSCEGS